MEQLSGRVYPGGSTSTSTEKDDGIEKSGLQFCVIQDNDCDWYIIPVKKEMDFILHRYRHSDVPNYSIPVGINPSVVTFDTFRIR